MRLHIFTILVRGQDGHYDLSKTKYAVVDDKDNVLMQTTSIQLAEAFVRNYKHKSKH